ncbi:unnamed protein product [Haemonchus placei]|uniref:PDZ domain-containing protein n=1 Tax=Haemonchus placei TaxID=6290 RepID=A0A0N4WQX2_HAEPC|nr:unnamed protein product [Haemonchus placei]
MSGTKEDGKKSKSSSSEEKEPQKMKKRRRKKKKGDTSPDEDELVALSKNAATLKVSDERIKVMTPEAAKHPETTHEGGADDREMGAKNAKESSGHGSGEKATGKPTDREKPVEKQSENVQSPDKMVAPPALDESAFETLEKPEILDEKEESNSEEELKRMLMEQEQKALQKKDVQPPEGVTESLAVPKAGQSHEIQSTRKPETIVNPVKKPKIESPEKRAQRKSKKPPIDVRKVKSADSGQKKEKMRKFSSVSEKMKKDISPRSSSRSRSEKTVSDKESPSTMSLINRSDILQTVDVPPRMPRRKSSPSKIKKEEVSPLIVKDFTKSYYALPDLEYHLRRMSSPPSRESLTSPTEQTPTKERKSSPTMKRSPTVAPYHSVLEVATARERAQRPIRSPSVVEVSTARERHWTKSRSPSNEVSRGKEQLLTPTRSPSVTEMSTAKERRRPTERRSSSLKELWSAKEYSHRRIASSPGMEASTARECTRIATRSHSVTEMVTARERSSRRVRRSPSATEISTAREHSQRKVSSPPMVDESPAIERSSREVSPALSPSFSSLKERPSLVDVELPEAKGFIEHPSVTPSETCVRKSASMIAVSPGVYRSEEPPIHHYKFVHVRIDLEGKPLDANLTENLVLIFIPINSPAFYHLVIGDQIVEINGLVPRNLTEFQERVEAATGEVMPQSMGAFAFLIVDRIIDIDSVKIPHKVNMVALKNRIRAVQERDGFCSFLVERPSSLHHLTNPSCVAMKSTEPTMDVVMADDAVEIGCREAFKHIQVKDRKHRHHSIYGSSIHGHSPQDGAQLITAEDSDDGN